MFLVLPDCSLLQGAICLDILGNGWSPVGTIKTALLSLRMLLEAPNPKDPQDAEVAKMMMDDHDYFESVAHDWAVKYAGAPRKRPSPEQVARKASEKKEDDIARFVGCLFSPPPLSQYLLSRLLSVLQGHER